MTAADSFIGGALVDSPYTELRKENDALRIGMSALAQENERLRGVLRKIGYLFEPDQSSGESDG